MNKFDIKEKLKNLQQLFKLKVHTLIILNI
jgi:hypothetical protein